MQSLGHPGEVSGQGPGLGSGEVFRMWWVGEEEGGRGVCVALAL